MNEDTRETPELKVFMITTPGAFRKINRRRYL